MWVDRDVIFDHWFFVGVTARKHEGSYVPALKSGAITMMLPDCVPYRRHIDPSSPISAAWPEEEMVQLGNRVYRVKNKGVPSRPGVQWPITPSDSDILDSESGNQPAVIIPPKEDALRGKA